MNGYSVEIKESSKELTAREKIKFKDISDSIKLDEATKESAIIIKPVAYVVLGIHNEKSDDKDYNNYLIVTEDGEKYVTGSESFWNAFMDIFGEMLDANEPFGWELKIYRLPSKNYKGKDFLTCSLI